jgi:hypothetical protein
LFCFITQKTQGVFPFIALVRLTSEASTLFINIRWVLLDFKMKSSIYYVINGLVALIMFGVFRVVVIVPLWISFFQLIHLPIWPNIHPGLKLLCVGTSIPLDFLNIYWFYKIVLMAIKIVKHKEISNHSNGQAKQDDQVKLKEG